MHRRGQRADDFFSASSLRHATAQRTADDDVDSRLEGLAARLNCALEKLNDVERDSHRPAPRPSAPKRRFAFDYADAVAQVEARRRQLDALDEAVRASSASAASSKLESRLEALVAQIDSRFDRPERTAEARDFSPGAPTPQAFQAPQAFQSDLRLEAFAARLERALDAAPRPDDRRIGEMQASLETLANRFDDFLRNGAGQAQQDAQRTERIADLERVVRDLALRRDFSSAPPPPAPAAVAQGNEVAPPHSDTAELAAAIAQLSQQVAAMATAPQSPPPPTPAEPPNCGMREALLPAMESLVAQLRLATEGVQKPHCAQMAGPVMDIADSIVDLRQNLSEHSHAIQASLADWSARDEARSRLDRERMEQRIAALGAQVETMVAAGVKPDVVANSIADLRQSVSQNSDAMQASLADWSARDDARSQLDRERMEQRIAALGAQVETMVATGMKQNAEAAQAVGGRIDHLARRLDQAAERSPVGASENAVKDLARKLNFVQFALGSRLAVIAEQVPQAATSAQNRFDDLTRQIKDLQKTLAERPEKPPPADAGLERRMDEPSSRLEKVLAQPAPGTEEGAAVPPAKETTSRFRAPRPVLQPRAPQAPSPKRPSAKPSGFFKRPLARAARIFTGEPVRDWTLLNEW